MLSLGAAASISAQTPYSSPSSLYTSLSASRQALAGSVAVQVSAPNSNCVFIGDSLTQGYTASAGHDYPTQAMSMPWFANCAKTNLAQDGWHISDITNDYQVHVHPLSPAVTSQAGYLFVMIGTNNIGTDNNTVATDFASLVSYWNTAIADGWNLVALLEPPNMIVDPTLIEQFNDMIRTSAIPWRIVDTYVIFGDPYNPYYYTPDQVHFQDAGYRTVAEAVNNQLMTGTPLLKASGLYGVGAGQGNIRLNATALGNTTTGANNTVAGYQDFFTDTTGSNSACYGAAAGYFNATGNYLACFGYKSLYSNSTAAGATELGYLAGSYANSAYSTFVGYEAGDNAVTSFVGKTTLGSAIITSGNTSAMSVGQTLQGGSIPVGSIITALTPNVSVTISANATATQGPYTIYGSGNPLMGGDHDTYAGANAHPGANTSPSYETCLGAACSGNGSHTVTLGASADTVYAPGGAVANSLQIAPTVAQPVCSLSLEGLIWYIAGSGSTAGAPQVCVNNNGAYGWMVLGAPNASGVSSVGVNGGSSQTGVVNLANIAVTNAANTFSGSVLFSPDATYSIGASGANRPLNFYAAGTGAFGGALSGSTMTINSSSPYIWTNRSRITSTADGVVTLVNQASTGFTGIQLGGTTSSFPQLRVNGTALEAKLADNSAYTGFNALTTKLLPVTFATLAVCGSTTEGTIAAVTDASTSTWGATIAGSGTNHVKAYCNGAKWIVD